MKVYLSIASHKNGLEVYKPYFEMLASSFTIVDALREADLTLILGAWSWPCARIARRSLKMGIPYAVCPLGDLSGRNRHNPGFRRSMQQLAYQQSLLRNASLLIATSPLEQKYLADTTHHPHIALLRYFAFTSQTTRSQMAAMLLDAQEEVLAEHEKAKDQRIAAKTKDAIAAQLLQIESRMPHENIPLSYLSRLHDLLYADNYDEDKLAAELNKLKLSPFARAVFEAMSEKTGLTEGFMPLPPKKSAKSKQIMKYVRS